MGMHMAGQMRISKKAIFKREVGYDKSRAVMWVNVQTALLLYAPIKEQVYEVRSSKQYILKKVVMPGAHS